MQVNLTNINRLANMNSVNLEVSKVDRNLKKATYFIEAWNRNEAIRKAISEFKWDYPYYNIKIVDLEVELISDGYGYAKNYYKVTIYYTNKHDDPGYGDVPFLP